MARSTLPVCQHISNCPAARRRILTRCGKGDGRDHRADPGEGGGRVEHDGQVCAIGATCEGANSNASDPDRGAHKGDCAGARACAQRELVGRKACCCIGDREAARGERSRVGVCDGGGGGKGNAGLVLSVGDATAAEVDDRHRTDLHRANVGRSDAVTVAVERTDSAALVLGKEDDSAGCINQGAARSGQVGGRRSTVGSERSEQPARGREVALGCVAGGRGLQRSTGVAGDGNGVHVAATAPCIEQATRRRAGVEREGGEVGSKNRSHIVGDVDASARGGGVPREGHIGERRRARCNIEGATGACGDAARDGALREGERATVESDGAAP